MTRRQFVESLTLGALAGAGATLSGCGPLPQPPLRVGAIAWPGYECLFLARALGLWNEHPIKLVDYPTTPEAVRAFRNGALEAVAVTGDEFLRLAAEEPSARAILVMDFSNGADALIAQPEHDCVRKLEGKRVGVEVNASGVFMLTRALDAIGMTTRDIEIVPLDNDQHLAAFEQRKVEGIVTFEPIRTRIVRKGGRVLFDSSRIPGEVSDLLATRVEVLEERMDQLKSVVKTWFAARDYLLGRTAEAASVIAARENLSPGEFIETLKLISIPSLEENRRLLAAGSELMEGLVKTHRVMANSGHFKIASPVLELFDARVIA